MPFSLALKKELCYKTGGLWRKKLKTIVGKSDPCRARPAKDRPLRKR